MNEENLKHLTLKGYCDWSVSLKAELDRFFEASRIMAAQTPLGRMERLAEKAHQIIFERGKFTSYDAVRLGVLDTNQKKRLFTILSSYPNVHVDKRPAQYSDRKKIISAVMERLYTKINFKGKQIPFQDIMLSQARSVANYLLDNNKPFEPFVYKW